MDEPVTQKCNKALISWVLVTTSAECKKVSGYSLFREGATNMAGKEPIEALINL
jgi:hypothetical protein